MSEYDRRIGVKYLRVRGFKAVRFCATLKAAPVNIFRATAVRRVRNIDKTAHQRGLSAHIHAIFVVKEHVLMVWSHVRNIFTLFDRRYGHPLIMAE